MKNEKPRVVKIHDVKIDSDYAQWLNEIKSRYRSAQVKASHNLWENYNLLKTKRTQNLHRLWENLQIYRLPATICIRSMGASRRNHR